jgi:hypothetical protein
MYSYGKSIYLTQKPNYGASYIDLINKDSNETELILSWVSLGEPYAQTLLDMGKSLEEGYDSHYILVRNKQASKEFFAEEEIYEYMKEAGGQYYPVQDDKEPVEGDEIAVFRSDQVLPRYVVRYSTKGEKMNPFKFDRVMNILIQRNNTSIGAF